MGNLCTHTLVSTTRFHRKHPQTYMKILLYPRCCHYLHFAKRDGLLIMFTWADRNFRFRWAVCQIEVLRKCLSVSVLRHALRTLPETLEETYDRVLMDIPREYHREAYSALQILSVAGNCVSVADVAEAVAVDRTSCTFDPENRLADPFDIVEVLSTLITYSSSQIALRHEKPLHGHFPGAERATEIRLAHYSVKEYLQSDRIRSKSTSKFYISSYEAEKCAAETCLTYLLWLDQPDSVSAELLLDFPFGLYAAEYW